MTTLTDFCPFSNPSLTTFIFPETPLEITIPLHDTKASEHTTVTLQCEVSKPDVKVTWMHNDTEVQLGPKYESIDEGTIHKLVIHDVTPDEAADYTIKVGDVTSTGHLHVEGRQDSSVDRADSS